MRASQACPATGLIAQVLMLVALALTVGLGRSGWVVGLVCAVVASGALSVGIARHRADALGPAMWVTLTRLTLAVCVAALAVDAARHDAHVGPLVAFAAVAIALDAVDGRVARRTGTTSALGARFDGEADAFLILALSAYVGRSLGWWVLVIGLMRYVFLAGEWTLPWMRASLPSRQWRKVVAATQAIVLTVAAADVVPTALARSAVAIALGMLVESFGRDTWWLWRRRKERPLDEGRGGAPVDGPPGRLRICLASVLTAGAVVLVWVALVLPNKLSQISLASLARIPIEGLVAVGALALMPVVARRVSAWILGALLALVVFVKILDIGFFTTFARPFNPVDDWSYASLGVETLRESVGRTRANVVVAVAVALLLIVLVLTALAMRRVGRVAADHRRWSLRVAGALGVVWVVARVAGAPMASAGAAHLALNEVQSVRNGLRDHRAFVRELANDRFRDMPGDRLLTGLRGKDVLLVFIESYGRSAVHGSSFAPGVDAVLDSGTRQLRAAGFDARSGFLTSPTFGGTSWLAHSTTQSGAWVTDNSRYSHLTTSNRFTLSQAFKRAGWRAIDVVPANDRTWLEGSLFYHYDAVYDRRNVGYRGPGFGYAPMPDQFTLLALHRLELASTHRRPLFAEVDLVSSHIPWTRIPHMIDWNQVGDGSIYSSLPVDESNQSALFNDTAKVRAAYGRSIEYSLSALLSFLRRYGNDDTVVVVLGDHQPSTIVVGENASHDVPISIIARDPKVLAQVRGWGWEPGMRPSPQAPVWRMDAFRDRFLTAFGSQTSRGVVRRP